MTHYLKSKDGSFKFKVDMYCTHPSQKNGIIEGSLCDGDCHNCKYGKATMTIKEMIEIQNGSH